MPKFELRNSFDDNLALFKAEMEAIDADCAKILFDNLKHLHADVDTDLRNSIEEFHSEVAKALSSLSEQAKDVR